MTPCRSTSATRPSFDRENAGSLIATARRVRNKLNLPRCCGLRMARGRLRDVSIGSDSGSACPFAAGRQASGCPVHGDPSGNGHRLAERDHARCISDDHQHRHWRRTHSRHRRRRPVRRRVAQSRPIQGCRAHPGLQRSDGGRHARSRADRRRQHEARPGGDRGERDRHRQHAAHRSRDHVGRTGDG